MPTFELTKDASDIQEAVLLPEDWYPFEVVEDPAMEANKALKEGGSEALKAGYNMVVKLACLDPTPEFIRRPFTVWLPFPNEGDKGKYTPIGQTVEDSKIERIVELVTAFGGEVEGASFNLSKGMKGQLYVTQGLDQAGVSIRNSINNFAGAKPFGGSEEEDGGDVPF